MALLHRKLDKIVLLQFEVALADAVGALPGLHRQAFRSEHVDLAKESESHLIACFSRCSELEELGNVQSSHS